MRLANDGMRIGGDPGDPMIHSTRFVLLDPAGVVRATYSPISDGEWLPKLLADLDWLRSQHVVGGAD